jgi:hypothetical protein
VAFDGHLFDAMIRCMLTFDNVSTVVYAALWVTVRSPDR